MQVDVIYLDVKKAFDTVSHRRLLCKLQGYRVDEELLKWIEEFLKNRCKRVKVNDKFSEWRKVVSGISQGFVLGATPFVIYINGLPNCVDFVCRIFADDT